jgi:hypothetical protein
MEAVRRKAFVLLLFFGAAIVSSATFFPAIDAESRLRLIEVWSVRASLLFAVIVWPGKETPSAPEAPAPSEMSEGEEGTPPFAVESERSDDPWKPGNANEDSR